MSRILSPESSGARRPRSAMSTETRLDKTAAIAGASGLVGRHCLSALLEHYDQVIAITRRPLDNKHPRLTQRTLQFADLTGLEIRADDVFCTLGSHPVEAGPEEFETVEFEYPKILARRAMECGARQFLFVTIIDTKYNSGFRRFTRMKRDLEQTVAKFPFDAVHVFRPSLLRGYRNRPRADERWMHAVMPRIEPFLIGPLSKYRAIMAQDVGRAMCAAALRGDNGFHIYHYQEMRELADSLEHGHR